MTLEEDCRKLIRKEFEASEIIQDIVSNNDLEDVDRELKEVCGELVSKANDPKRKKKILIITFRLGQTIESDDVVVFAKKHLEEWKEKYGGRV